MSFRPGTIVRARKREWVVLPSSDEKLLHVRPIGGHELETTAILPSMEEVEPATFDLPTPEMIGDYRSARLLWEAARLSTRAAATPLRCFSRIGVDPRPYQLVPLLMGMRMDPVRLLIADDVGIGKTIEALLILRELVDRGEVTRFCVLCPPPLAEQWQKELRTKFNLEAELVLSGTAGRLERSCPGGKSLFEHYPQTVVSLDYIKSPNRRAEFIRTCPELIVVDEAHTCSPSASERGSAHQRYTLLRELAEDKNRNMILVTATPHSGNETAFDALVGLLNSDLASGDVSRETVKERLARHFIQRRRLDIRSYLETDTHFPARRESEIHYELSPEYTSLFDRAIHYAQESVRRTEGGERGRRIRWWSALALLRALGSSPAAAAATLATRAASAEASDAAEADEIGMRTVLDLNATDSGKGMDIVAGSILPEEPGGSNEAAGDAITGTSDAEIRQWSARALREMARQAIALSGKKDTKLAAATAELRSLVSDGFHPIVFCRFIETAHYVGDHLKTALGSNVAVEVVTGELPPEEREQRVAELGEEAENGKTPVLVATDCLSEGVNLQEHFTAVFHYDLSWNPTRHEQREGRVDRYGQRAREVRTVTLFGIDNRIDGLVLDVLIKKHKSIKSDLGISVPVPVDTNDVLKALLEGLMLRKSWKGGGDKQLEFAELAPDFYPLRDGLHREWEAALNREKASWSRYSHLTIQPDEVALELEAAREIAGDTASAAWLLGTAIPMLNGRTIAHDGVMEIDATGLPSAIRETMRLPKGSTLFALHEPLPDRARQLRRTDTAVDALATLLVDTALDNGAAAVARRAGVIRTNAVSARTTLLLVRFRYEVSFPAARTTQRELVEETRLLGLTGSTESGKWIDQADLAALLVAEPTGNVDPGLAADALSRILASRESLRKPLGVVAAQRAQKLEKAYERVRRVAGARRIAGEVTAQSDPDILGIYVYLPAPAPGVSA